MARPHPFDVAWERACAVRYVAKQMAGYTGQDLANPNINPEAHHLQAAFKALYRPMPADLYDVKRENLEDYADSLQSLEASWLLDHREGKLELQPLFFDQPFRLFEGATSEHGLLTVPNRVLVVPGEPELEIMVRCRPYNQLPKASLDLTPGGRGNAWWKPLGVEILFSAKWGEPLSQDILRRILRVETGEEELYGLPSEEDWVINYAHGSLYHYFAETSDNCEYPDASLVLAISDPEDTDALQRVTACFEKPADWTEPEPEPLHDNDQLRLI